MEASSRTSIGADGSPIQWHITSAHQYLQVLTLPSLRESIKARTVRLSTNAQNPYDCSGGISGFGSRPCSGRTTDLVDQLLDHGRRGWEIRGTGDGEGVLEVASHGIERAAQLHDGPLPARHLDDLGGDVETAHGLGKPVVVCENDDLPIRGGPLEDTGQAVDSGRIHRLHRIVDHDEAERALGERGPRHEEAERERVQLTLAHHSQCGSLDPVHGDVERHAAPSAFTGELDPPQLDVALLAEMLPDPGRFLGDRSEAVVAYPGRGLLSTRC